MGNISAYLNFGASNPFCAWTGPRLQKPVYVTYDLSGRRASNRKTCWRERSLSLKDPIKMGGYRSRNSPQIREVQHWAAEGCCAPVDNCEDACICKGVDHEIREVVSERHTKDFTNFSTGQCITHTAHEQLCTQHNTLLHTALHKIILSWPVSVSF